MFEDVARTMRTNKEYYNSSAKARNADGKRQRGVRRKPDKQQLGSKKELLTRHTDPDPYPIVMIITEVIRACVRGIGDWLTSHRRLPHKIRRQLLTTLDKLSAETSSLHTDIAELESIFSEARFPQGPTLRSGNRAMLTSDEFRRYERTADRVFSSLKRIHKLTLRAERLAVDLLPSDRLQIGNVVGKVLERAENLRKARNYTVSDGLGALKQLVTDMEKMIIKLRGELG
jgi:hypothetical protein